MKEARSLAWLKRMETEHANLRAALDWSLDEDVEAGGREELGLRLAIALYWFWHARGSMIEGRSWLQRDVSARSSPTTTRLRVSEAEQRGDRCDDQSYFWR